MPLHERFFLSAETLANTKWKVMELRLPNSTNTLYPTKDYMVEFRDEKSMGIKLDINNCGGGYELSEDKAIKISPLACTKACCDSEFASNLASTLSTMTAMKGSGKNLILENPIEKSKIKLQLVE